MDKPQFERWFKHHVTRFPGVVDWLNSFTGSTSRDDVIKAWLAALSSVRIDDAIAATDAIFRGDAPKPFGYEQTPAEIKKFASAREKSRQSAGRKYIGGERVVSCRTCADRGIATIWTRKFLSWAADAFGEEPPTTGWVGWYRDVRATAYPRPAFAAVACDCERGSLKESSSVLLTLSRDVDVIYDPWGLKEAIEFHSQQSF